jgi:hypothetical protein
VNNDEQLPLVSGARSMVQNNSWGDDDAGLKSMASAKAAAPMSDLKKKLLGAILACVAGLAKISVRGTLCICLFSFQRNLSHFYRDHGRLCNAEKKPALH